MTHMRAVHATSPEDLLALVPSLLGFHPEDSLVVLTVGLAGEPVHARVDLPRDPREVDGLAAHLTGVAVRNGVTHVAVVAYTDDAPLARTVVEALLARLHGESVALVCSVRADGERWWAMAVGGDTDAPGTRYDVRSHPLMVAAVVEGAVVLGSRQELAASLEVGDAAEARVISAHADAVVARLRHAATRSGEVGAARRLLGGESRWVAHRVRRFLDDGERLDGRDVARLVALMALSYGIRDVAWAEISRTNAVRHVDLWRDVVRRAPASLRAAPASLLGFAAWQSGNGALAWCAVECAQEAEPGYSMAGLLTQVLAGGLPPSAWRPPPRTGSTLPAD